MERGIKKSEEQHFIVPNQVGRRKHRSSQFPIRIEISHQEISRLSRKEYGQINYNAKEYYTRILSNIAVMLGLIHGIFDEVFQLHNKMLLQMCYKSFSQ
jgi:hypothetical protein